MKVAAIQFEVNLGAVESNREKAEALIRKAGAMGASLVLLPELWPTGYALERLDSLAETMRDGSVSLLRRLARELSIFIVGGSLAEKKDGKYFNTSVAINPAGDIVAKYRKSHLYPHGLCEDRYFSPGDEWTLAECGGLSLGMTICYDAYFPEFARNLCLRGAQLLTLPAAWDASALDRFHILAQARAVENHCFVIAANHCGGNMAGHSLIVSPLGKILAEAEGEATALMAELDMAEFKYLRENRNTINDRRNILDEIDNSQL